MKRLIMFIDAVFAVIGLGAGGYFYKIYSIRTNGIALTASADYPLRSGQYYMQNDSLWGDDNIGQTSSTLGSKGCLISSIATAITELGTPVTPQELNEKL